MIALEDARAAILGIVTRLEAVMVPIADALGRVVAEAVIAPEAVPPFANTAMDGYAVRAVDVASAPVRLRVVDELPAGRAPRRAVEAGEAIRIMTGAPMPDGADAVVRVERTTRDGEVVVVEAVVSVGDHVRPAGGDVATGDVVFEPGTVVNPAAIGVLASLGMHEVHVGSRPRVGVLSSGDELVETGPLALGKIRDANRPMLLALVAQAGATPVDLGCMPDEEQVIARTLEDASATCDLVITSGGVSVGDFDYVKAALAKHDAYCSYQVAIRPAKPLAFGMVNGTPVFGLPGNPVSSLVSFELFARPAIRVQMGHPGLFRPEVDAIAAENLSRHPDGKLHLDRVRLWWEQDSWRVARTGAQASNALAATALANGLALIPDGDGVAAGNAVRVMRLDA